MSMSLEAVLEHSGYKLSKEEDARWLVSKVAEFEELVVQAEDLIEQKEEERREQERLEEEEDE